MNPIGNLLWNIKLWFFDKKNESYKKNLKINHDFLWKILLDFIAPLFALICCVLFILFIYISALAIIMLVAYFIAIILAYDASKTSNVISFIAAIVPVICVCISKVQKKSTDTEIQSCAKIIIRYLVEVINRNVDYKISKEDTCYILLMCPNKVLKILHDIQIDISKQSDIKEGSFTCEQIVFLIDYLKNYAYLKDVPMDSLDYHIITEVIKNSDSENLPETQAFSVKSRRSRRKAK